MLYAITAVTRIERTEQYLVEAENQEEAERMFDDGELVEPSSSYDNLLDCEVVLVKEHVDVVSDEY